MYIYRIVLIEYGVLYLSKFAIMYLFFLRWRKLTKLYTKLNLNLYIHSRIHELYEVYQL